MVHGDSEHDDLQVSRRRLLQAASMAGVMGIAGCSGSSDGGDGGDGGGGNSQVVDQAFVAVQWVNPNRLQFNPWAATTAPIEAAPILYEPMGALNNLQEGPSIFPHLVDWSWEGKTMTLQYRDRFSDLKWHNGDAVTARDLEMQLKLEKYANVSPIIGYPYNPYKFIDSVSQAGDGKVAIKTKSETMNKRIVESVFTVGGGFGPQLHTNRNVFGKHLEALEDATTEAERNKLVSKLRQRKIEKPVGNGPFQYKELTNQRLVLERVPDHPDADRINFSRFEFKYEPNAQRTFQDIIGNKIDGVCCASGQKSKTRMYPDSIESWFMSGIYGGKGINFDHSDPVFGTHKVRQAIAHVINRKQVSNNAFPLVSRPTKRPMGIHNIGQSNPKDWTGDNFEKYNDYSQGESNVERAAELMREADFTKKNGSWYRPDGKKISFEYIEGTEQEKIRFGRTAVQQLKDFGFDATFSTMEDTTYDSRVQNGDWRIITVSPEAWLPHPYFLMDKVFSKSALWMGKNNYPDEVEVPGTIGDPNSSTKTFNTDDLLEKLKTVREEEAKGVVQQLAWIVNQDLPALRVYDSGDETILARGDDWEWPDDGIPPHDAENPLDYDPEKIHPGLEVKWPYHWMPRTGDFKAKQ